MLSVLEPATIDANIDELVLHVGVDPTVSSRRSAYFEALNRIQPIALPMPLEHADLPWVLTFTADEPPDEDALRYAVTDDTGSRSGELELLTPSEAADVARHLENALEILRTYNPDSAAAAVKLNSWFLFARSIGAMDGDPDAKVTSAIRRTRRRFDLAFHAACVAVELVGLHEHLGLSERAETHREGAVSSIDELKQHLDLFSEHGLSVFEDVERCLNTRLAER